MIFITSIHTKIFREKFIGTLLIDLRLQRLNTAYSIPSFYLDRAININVSILQFFNLNLSASSEKTSKSFQWSVIVKSKSVLPFCRLD